MKKTFFSVFSVFALTPVMLFSMIFPISLLSFSMVNSNSTKGMLVVKPVQDTNHFTALPSDGSYPVGEYIDTKEIPASSHLAEIPNIGYTMDMLPDGAKKILPQDLSQNGNMLINGTSYSVDTEKAVSAFAPSHPETAGPLVLVVHTHATESFLTENNTFKIETGDSAEIYYDTKAETRSTDCSQNVVHLGEIFCNILSEHNIEAVHCRELHDYPDYNKSYSNSYKSVKEYLAKYPSIKYVIDLHRDSIIRENGDKVKPICNIDGKEVAQIMAVIGSASKHPEWRTNLAFALKYKSACDSAYPGFTRPVYLRTPSFNQELSPGMLILEVGSCGNSLKEAEYAAEYAAKAFAKTIMQ